MTLPAGGVGKNTLLVESVLASQPRYTLRYIFRGPRDPLRYRHVLLMMLVMQYLSSRG